MFDQCCAGRRAKLALQVAREAWDARQQQRRGRGGYGQDPVGAADGAKAGADRRGRDVLYTQLLDHHADSGDIRYRVHGAELMKIDVFYGLPVYRGLGLGDQLIDRQHMGLDALAQIELFHDLPDIEEMAMMVLMMRTLAAGRFLLPLK